MALAAELGPREAADEEADASALDAPEVIDSITDETELAKDSEADAEEAADDWDEATELSDEAKSVVV